MTDSRQDLEREQFLQMFLNDTPLMDVRAPVEFKAGSFPSAQLVPILDDEQRHEIGCVYADDGQDAAIERGLALATKDIRECRLAAWQAFVQENPHGYLYCFRGGLRSRTTQSWLAESGHPYPLVQGGYKAMRRFLLNEFERLLEQGNIILLAGATGVGKTELIQDWFSSIDLEGRANHRGSAFGQTFVNQPTQIDWENQIIIDWLKAAARSDSAVLIEAESHLIGRIHLPKKLQKAMAKASVLMLEAPIEQRVNRLRDDYVQQALSYFKSQVPVENADEDEGVALSVDHDIWGQLSEYVNSNLAKIQKRLGGVRHKQLAEQVDPAVYALRDNNDSAGFDFIIKNLLLDYYDKLYAHQQQKQNDLIVCRGDMKAIKQWLANSERRTQKG